jgi:hypothetical protein
MQRAQTWRMGLRWQSPWLILAVIANGLDLVSTVVGLRLGIPEDNPLMSWVLGYHGELAMYVLKVLIVTSLVLFVGYLQRHYRRAWIFFLPMIFLPILAVANNLALMLHLVG